MRVSKMPSYGSTAHLPNRNTMLLKIICLTTFVIAMLLCHFQFRVRVLYMTVFQCIERTCKNYMLAIDAGQSMQFGGVLGCESVTPLIASAAMAMTFVQSEPNCQVVGLASALELLDVRSTSSLPDVCTAVSRVHLLFVFFRFSFDTFFGDENTEFENLENLLSSQLCVSGELNLHFKISVYFV